MKRFKFLIGVLGAASVLTAAFASSGCNQNAKGGAGDASSQKPLSAEARQEMMRQGRGAGASGAGAGGTGTASGGAR